VEALSEAVPFRTWGARCAGFWALFLPHLVLAPLALFLVVTPLHEIAHAAAVWLIGGEVTELSFLPGARSLGHITWTPPTGAGLLEDAVVRVAPYVMWSASAAAVLALCLARRRLHRHVASTLFVWGYAVPVGDIALNLTAGRGDLAFPGVEGLAVTAIGLLLVLVAYVLGHGLQRRLFAEASVDFAAYLVSTLVLGLAFGAAALLGLLLLG
jgi:hypothetical protein